MYIGVGKYREGCHHILFTGVCIYFDVIKNILDIKYINLISFFIKFPQKKRMIETKEKSKL